MGEESVVDGDGVVSGGEVGEEELSFDEGDGTADGPVGGVADFDGRAGEGCSGGVDDEAGDGSVDCGLSVRGRPDRCTAEYHNRDVRRNLVMDALVFTLLAADTVTTERHALSPRK